MAILNCKVNSVEAINDTVYRVKLTPLGEFSFQSGQYLMIIMGDGDLRPFSMASTPLEKKEIELHIGTSDFNTYGMAVMDRIFQNRVIDIDIPHGHAWFRQGSRHPLLLIAGGTGFSYVRSILLSALSEQPYREISVYWGGRELKHLYDLEALQALSIQHSMFTFVPVIEQDQPSWKGKTGTVLNAVLEDYELLTEQEIYIAGRFEMAKIAQKQFCERRNANSARIYGDAFDFLKTASKSF
ncbi:NAD(P)H-flavin reductase [Candidatus Williamhamiltonella defendens]|uniref:NAD(P)H-flavin reductase n=1 Tax=Candidatus Williamhamiltonella defendens TaxID=138072 RepID=UPI00130DE3A6|nr:NAD(P)H-flavin reductase [Candidatus Hamiltonella defensa]